MWLDEWQWACCGRPFRVGDLVDFRIVTRAVPAALAAELGPDLAATLDAIESHHDDDPAEQVRGTVAAIHAVDQEFTERRILRRPGFGAPLDARMPPAGEEWPPQLLELGNGVSVGTQPSRYIVQQTPVVGATTLRPVDHVGRSEGGATAPLPRSVDSGRPSSRPRPIGWVVDLVPVEGES